VRQRNQIKEVDKKSSAERITRFQEYCQDIDRIGLMGLPEYSSNVPILAVEQFVMIK
jgi:hypothetical protein